MGLTIARARSLSPSPTLAAILLCAAGVLIAVSAHLATKVAERRARERYQELAGALDFPGADDADDGWKDVRSLVGRWGCLVTVMEFVRGVGVVVAMAAGLYLITQS